MTIDSYIEILHENEDTRIGRYYFIDHIVSIELEITKRDQNECNNIAIYTSDGKENRTYVRDVKRAKRILEEILNDINIYKSNK